MSHTVAAISTGLQNCAIGVIRMSGDEAIAIAERATGKAFADRVATYCTVYDANGSVLDRIVCTVFYAPHSYTGENMAELSCPGGMVVLGEVMKRLCELGAEPAARGEFTKRAFLNGKMDLSQSEAVIDVSMAKSPLSVKEAFSRVSGNLKNKINAFKETLLEIDTDIMAYVDFSAEGIDAPDGDALAQRLSSVKDGISSLAATYGAGKIIKEGYPVCLCGKPNAGKSSIMNALLGADRSIVTSQEGTTRDVISETAVIDGLAVLLSDTAGIREAENEVEQIGISRAKDIIKESGLIVCVFDSGREFDSNDEALIDLAKGENAIAVINKSDLACVLDISRIEKCFDCVLSLSAADGTGLEGLKAAIKSRALSGADMHADALITSLRQKTSLENATEALNRAIDALSMGIDPEICEPDIALALSHLGELTGECLRDDMIDRIFEKFCVGK